MLLGRVIASREAPLNGNTRSDYLGAVLRSDQGPESLATGLVVNDAL